MKEQNFDNHIRKVPKTFYLAALLALIVFITSAIYACTCCNSSGGFTVYILLTSLALAVIFTTYFSRIFALKAQDRAIRAEENLRHFAMTGKLLDAKLTLSQIIALRFASDEEFVQLAQKAVNENLSNKEIKQAIKNWKGDYYRV